jgi:hypothetical protein
MQNLNMLGELSTGSEVGPEPLRVTNAFIVPNPVNFL